VVTLEFAMLVPVVGLMFLAVLLAGIHATDQIAVQDAARAAARTAATTAANGSVLEVAYLAAAPRVVRVTVLPTRRVSGTAVHVTVVHTRDVGWLQWTVIGKATAVAEPVLR
jgi:Flp pilus assembly protein TadG